MGPNGPHKHYTAGMSRRRGCKQHCTYPHIRQVVLLLLLYHVCVKQHCQRLGVTERHTASPAWMAECRPLQILNQRVLTWRVCS